MLKILLLLLLSVSLLSQVDTTNLVSGFAYVQYTPLDSSAWKFGVLDSLQDVVTGDYHPVVATNAAASDSFLMSNKARYYKGYDSHQLFTDKAAGVQRLNLPNSGLSDGAFTLLTIFNKEVYDPSENQLLISLANGATPYYWVLIASTDSLLRMAHRPAGVTSFTSTQKFEINTWYHLVCVYDFPNTKAYIYINGELDSEHTMSSKSTTPERWFLGQFDVNRTQELQGWQRAAFIYSDAKSAEWVTDEYAKLDPNMELLQTAETVVYPDGFEGFPEGFEGF